ncbi:uncharacterized protein EI90DRAFT_1339440 [Cantharellus anzutake]|uniref:uncharacterized protein n=1 Tax=Cantharellus anzutake TaxID=1750568 RepID=UPI001906C557|nr:uncharacterized protein EI90DRAFT_1339440 [Cantharellus anzutake]KAF8329739.1 hypothetical protein EI90DRAFT_1339440 [Cantharellus anzutake]
MCFILERLLALLKQTDVGEHIRSPNDVKPIVNKLRADDRSRWKDWIGKGVKCGDWASLIVNCVYQPAFKDQAATQDHHQGISAEISGLARAYRSPFMGAAPRDFIEHLTQIDKRVVDGLLPIYCKSISVVQSSGTGKSRMLTEVGAKVFTLPICLRDPNDPGYPLSDEAPFVYFRRLRFQFSENDLSLSTLSGIAHFLTAAYQTMLSRLQDIKQEVGNDCEKIRQMWYWMMEKDISRSYRMNFFQDVVERAGELEKIGPGGSPQRDRAKKHVKEAFEDLMAFIETLTSDICVTYFDEAHELQMCFWIMMHLLHAQDQSKKMWHVFIATKSPISYSSPSPRNMISARLREETLLPYFALDFDQQAIKNTNAPGPVKMSDFETIEHLAQYGRPLYVLSSKTWGRLPTRLCRWHAQSHESITAAIKHAASKLTEFHHFKATDPNHVFAVLSQRLCLDPVLSNARAVELADHSVAHHMRLLTGFLFGGAIFRTDSPSEPLLALGAAFLMYKPNKEPNTLAAILETLNLKLCKAGLIENGFMGELAARFLLLVARDYAAPADEIGPNLLKPVRLLEVLRKLFGDLPWDDNSVAAAFGGTYVNFTHWIITKDPLPEKPSRKLLSNLWARGAILQCYFNQISIDFLCPIYLGSVLPEDIFDSDRLSGLVVQVRFNDEGEVNAQREMEPARIIRDSDDPLPYLVLLMELSTTSQHRDSLDAINDRIKIIPPDYCTRADYERLTGEHEKAFQKLSQHQVQHPQDKKGAQELKAEVESKQLEKEHYNRYVITARANTYPILDEAEIAWDFRNLLQIVKPQLAPLDIAAGHMRPLEHLRDTDWLFDYA